MLRRQSKENKGSQAKVNAEFAEGINYIFDDNSFFSIDGERYRAQKMQGKVMKEALSIYC